MGWLTVGVLSCASFGVTMWLCLQHHLGIYTFDKHYHEQSYWIYNRTYTRIPAYFIGIVSAWVLNEMEQKGFTREARPFTFRARAIAVLIATIAIALLILIIFFPATDFGRHQNSWDKVPVAEASFITFSRPLWTICLGALTLLCYYGYLPLVDGFLSHPVWTPMARLTYGAYLFHPCLLALAGSRMLQFNTFSNIEVVCRWCGISAMACLGSVVLWVLVEQPCMTIFSPSKTARNPKGDQSRMQEAEQFEKRAGSKGWLITEQPCMTVSSPKNARNSKEDQSQMEKAEHSGKPIDRLDSTNDIETTVVNSNAPAA